MYAFAPVEFQNLRQFLRSALIVAKGDTIKLLLLYYFFFQTHKGVVALGIWLLFDFSFFKLTMLR